MPEPNPGSTPLHEWMQRQCRLSADAMLGAISATHLVKDRSGFGQYIRPARGSVLASPVSAFYDPDPDYFFHWARDSAVVMDALRVLYERGFLGDEALGHFSDFVNFSLSLLSLDGVATLRMLGDFRSKVEPKYLQFVRDDEELGAITRERVQGEPRFNPDGTLDIIKWSRPQHDGPASRALTLLRFWPIATVHAPDSTKALRKLIDADLDFILHHWREPSFDIWEEELGHHYYTRLVHLVALEEGTQWHERLGESGRAQAEREAVSEISSRLEAHWSPEKGFYMSRLAGEMVSPEKALDMATILAVIHAGRREGPHTILDPKVLATLARLEALFASDYTINKSCGADRAPAMGRYVGDRYYSGGAYYFSTLGAAEFYYRLAASLSSGATFTVTAENEIPLRAILEMAQPSIMDSGVTLDAYCMTPKGRAALVDAFLQRGDAFMATVAAYTPASGDLSEQFDQTTGAQTSAKNLAWSHAAFITAFASREAVGQPILAS